MWRRRRLGQGERLDLLEALSDAGCAACRERERAVRRWFWTYANDSAGDLTVRLLMQRTLGMCAAHTRRLLALGAPSSWLAKTLFGDVARAARTAVTNRTPPSEPCPPCRVGADAARDLIDTLVAALRDPEIEPDIATYVAESDGLCAGHTRSALRRANHTSGRQLATVLARSLAGDASRVLVAMTGYDPDVARVIEGRRAAPSQQDSDVEWADVEHGDVERADVDVIRAGGCCPLCAAADRATRRALSAAEVGERGVEPTEGGTELGELCPHHLAVFAADGVTDTVRAAIMATARPWQTALEAYLVGRRRRKWGPFGIGGRGLTVRVASCLVCQAGSAAVTAQAELLGWIGSDPEYESAVASAHGVCVRHGLSADLAGARGERWRGLLVTRLTELANDLERSRRLDTWQERHVGKGPEAHAWRRAPTLLDGAILDHVLGGAGAYEEVGNAEIFARGWVIVE